MADEVVGSVTVNVHGDTDPLKSDIKRATVEAGKTLDDGIGKGAAGTGITDNIVKQVGAAEKPAGDRAKGVGRAIVNGVDIGIGDGNLGLDDAVTRSMGDAEKAAEQGGRDIARVFKNAIRDDRGSIQIGPDVTAAFAEVRRLAGNLWPKDNKAFEDSVKATLTDVVTTIHTQDPGAEFDESLRQGAERLQSQLATLLPNEKDGARSGKKVADGMKGSILQAGVEKMFMLIAGKAATIGPLIAVGVRAAVPLVLGLTGEIATLSTALGGLGAVGAASFATLIPGIGALKIAFAGMDAKAKKALTDRFTAAAGDLKGFKERVRNEIIPSLIDAVGTISKLAPEINKLGTDAAKAGGKIAKSFANMLVGRKAEIGNIFGNSSKVMEAFGTAGTQAIDVIINALDALQPFVMQVTDAFGDGIEKMTQFFNKKIDDGTFQRTMALWVERGRDVLAIFKNLGIFLGNFFRAAGGASDAFLGSFRNLTEEWADWSKSVTGQNTLKKMFDDAVPVIEEVWGLIGDIAGLFTKSFTGDTGNLVDLVKSIRENVIPAFEDLQSMLRESGIQDALFELGGAVAKLFSSGSFGASTKVFIDTLTVIVNLIADLTDALGPALVPLATFFGMFKAFSITKSAFSSLFTLPSFFTKLIAPAEGATKAIEGVKTAASETSDAVGGATTAVKGSGALTKFGTMLTGLGTGLNYAAIGYTALATAIQVTVPKFDNSTGHITALVNAAKTGSASLQETGKGIGDNFWEKWVFAGGALSGAKGGARTFGDEMGADLGQSFSASFKQTMAAIGLDFGGVESTSEGLKARFDSIKQSLAISGDVEAAKTAFNNLGAEMDRRGVDAGDYADDIHSVELAIQKARAQAEAGLTIRGNFSTIKTGLESFSQSFDQNVTQKLNGLLTNPLYVDAKTGALNKLGKSERRKIIAEIDMTSLNGVDNAIDEATGDKIRKVYLDPDRKGFVDKFGQLTAKGLNEIVHLIVEDQEDPKNQERVKARARNLKKIADTELLASTGQVVGKGPLQQAGTAALTLYVPEENKKKISDDLKSRFGSEIIGLKTKLEKEGNLTPEEIQRELGIQAPVILAKLKIDEKTNTARAELESLVGTDWSATIMTNFPEAQYAKVSGQLLKLTYGPNGTSQWTAVVGAEAKTAEAKNDILVVEKGPGGKGYKATIKVHEEGAAAANNAIDTAAKDENATIFVKVDWSKYKPGYRIGPNGQPIAVNQDGSDKATGSAIIPPAGAPPTITAGGPTTMGFGATVTAGITPFAGQRASIMSASGNDVTGSPNVWTGADKDKATKNVTINNYYPEPERASDTIAMQMRIARYV